ATLTIVQIDFGDAPDSLGYPTLMIFNGARHRLVPGIYLGTRIDFEPDGQPDPNATGDDLNGINDDDGVKFTTPLLVGQMAKVDLIASINGLLDAWVDFDANGSWADPGEQIFASQPLTAGTNHLSFPVPTAAVPSNTFARFRFSTAGHLSFDGPAADGEVEDYQVTIAPAIDLAITLAASPEPAVIESNLTYTITVVNGGPSTASAVTIVDQLPEASSFIIAAASQGDCANIDGVVSCALGDLAAGDQASITLTVAGHRTGLL